MHFMHRSANRSTSAYEIEWLNISTISCMCFIYTSICFVPIFARYAWQEPHPFEAQRPATRFRSVLWMQQHAATQHAMLLFRVYMKKMHSAFSCTRQSTEHFRSFADARFDRFLPANFSTMVFSLLLAESRSCRGHCRARVKFVNRKRAHELCYGFMTGEYETVVKIAREERNRMYMCRHCGHERKHVGHSERLPATTAVEEKQKKHTEEEENIDDVRHRLCCWETLLPGWFCTEWFALDRPERSLIFVV